MSNVDKDFDLPYILGYKSHFLNLNIGSKIECVLYVSDISVSSEDTVDLTDFV